MAGFAVTSRANSIHSERVVLTAAHISEVTVFIYSPVVNYFSIVIHSGCHIG